MKTKSTKEFVFIYSKDLTIFNVPTVKISADYALVRYIGQGFEYFLIRD